MCEHFVNKRKTNTPKGGEDLVDKTELQRLCESVNKLPDALVTRLADIAYGMALLREAEHAAN